MIDYTLPVEYLSPYQHAARRQSGIAFYHLFFSHYARDDISPLPREYAMLDFLIISTHYASFFFRCFHFHELDGTCAEGTLLSSCRELCRFA